VIEEILGEVKAFKNNQEEGDAVGVETSQNRRSTSSQPGHSPVVRPIVVRLVFETRQPVLRKEKGNSYVAVGPYMTTKEECRGLLWSLSGLLWDFQPRLETLSNRASRIGSSELILRSVAGTMHGQGFEKIQA
jgi:hypothetical protein